MSEPLPKKPDIALGIYRHYKSHEYEVVGLALHSEFLQWQVIYRPLYENPGADTWARPIDMFMGNVVVNGSEVPRFKFIRQA